jgi:hypothetical protein
LLGIRKASLSHHVFHHDYHIRQSCICLCDKGGGGGALVPPGRGEDTDGLVVAGQLVNVSVYLRSFVRFKETYAVDAGLNENQAELAVPVLAVGLEVLADGNGLLDQHVEVLGDVWAKAYVHSCQRELNEACLYSATDAHERAELRRLALSGIGIRTVGLEDAEDPKREIVSPSFDFECDLNARTCYRSRP